MLNFMAETTAAAVYIQHTHQGIVAQITVDLHMHTTATPLPHFADAKDEYFTIEQPRHTLGRSTVSTITKGLSRYRQMCWKSNVTDITTV